MASFPAFFRLSSVRVFARFGRHQWIFSLIELVELEQFLTTKSRHMTQEEKQAKALEIIKNHLGFSLGAALVPLPGADLLAVSGVQLNMLRQLAKLYQVNFMDALGKNFISAVVGGSAARLGASLVKIIPGVGTVIGELSMPVLSGASTYALGKVAANHFQSGGTLADFDLPFARKKYRAEMAEAQDVAVQISTTPAETTDETFSKLQKLSEMKQAGILTEEEFGNVKARLLAQI